MATTLGRWLHRGVPCVRLLRAVVTAPAIPVPVRRWYSDELEFKEPAEGYRYCKSHEWASLDGNIATIGISNYAQEKLGDIVFAEMPSSEDIGTEYSKEDQFGVLESVKAAADIHVPISGTLEEVNSSLEDEPDLVNKDPYNKGWLVKLKDVDVKEYEELMSSSEYRQFLEETV